MISWVNPDERLSGKSFENYMNEGPLAALDAMAAATGEKEANVIGYCLGGTLLSATLAYMTTKRDRRVKSATFFVTMVDFAEAGDLSVFIDEEQITALEERMAKKGYLEARDMHTTFNMLRANDLIWSFVVNNYLLGKQPFPFDLLYWNADSTRLPAAMHSFYLRKMYQENLLSQPGGVTLDGVKIDLRKVKTPALILSTREDHIAPWRSTYRATQLYSGPVKFVLAASGHIAGVVNAPGSKSKYGALDQRPEPALTRRLGWRARPSTTAHGGRCGEEWVSQYTGGEVPARSARRRQAQTARRRTGKLCEGASGGLTFSEGEAPHKRRPEIGNADANEPKKLFSELARIHKCLREEGFGAATAGELAGVFVPWAGAELKQKGGIYYIGMATDGDTDGSTKQSFKTRLAHHDRFLHEGPPLSGLVLRFSGSSWTGSAGHYSARPSTKLRTNGVGRIY